MRRLNLKQAFVGEGDPSQEGLDAEQDSNEEVEFRVVDGRVAFVVPPGTPDDQVIEAQIYTRAELILEDGRRVTIGMHVDTVGAEVSEESAAQQAEALPDLSTASQATPGDAG